MSFSLFRKEKKLYRKVAYLQVIKGNQPIPEFGNTFYKGGLNTIHFSIPFFFCCLFPPFFLFFSHRLKMNEFRKWLLSFPTPIYFQFFCSKTTHEATKKKKKNLPKTPKFNSQIYDQRSFIIYKLQSRRFY